MSTPREHHSEILDLRMHEGRLNFVATRARLASRSSRGLSARRRRRDAARPPPARADCATRGPGQDWVKDWSSRKAKCPPAA